MTRIVLGAVLATALSLAPAAQASTVKETLDADLRVTTEYRAANAEANDLTVSFLGATVFKDAGASIKPGPGCWSVVDGASCSANPWLIDVLLRNGDDKTVIHGYPHVQYVNVSGGPGDDTAVAIASSDAQVDGDQGDDVITAQGDVRAIADGGSGDDVVTTVPYLARGEASGGSGSDELHFRPAGGMASEVEMDGGTGPDLLVAHPAARAGSTLDGGTGDDVITVSDEDPLDGRGFTIVAGTGDDTVFAGHGDDTIDAGPGRDVIDVQGGGTDTVTCGLGIDVVRSDADDSVAADCEIVVK